MELKIYELLKKGVSSACQELYGAEVKPGQVQVEETRADFEGDLTIIVFPLLRFSRKKPEETAVEIGNFLIEKLKEITDFKVIKGFLNLELSHTFWLQYLKTFKGERQFKAIQEANPAKVMVEYSSPNTNKPLHLGHIRNNLIGHSVSEILKARGHEVIKANLINDRGIHICKSMLAWQLFGKGETPASSGMKGDFLVGKYYVLFENKFREEVKDLMQKGLSKDEAEKESTLLQKAKDLLIRWEEEDPEVREVWSKMNGWTYAGFDETYNRMGISFDKVYHESETYLLGKKLVHEGLEKAVFYQKEDGSVWCSLKEEGLDEKLLLRADGTSVYMTQDLGTAQLKYDDFHAGKSIYIVGNEQDYHFNVLKMILKKLNKPYADSVFHLSYGMVDLPDGKMKSREGKVIDADDLMDEMSLAAVQIIDESGKMSDIQGEAKEELAEMIGQSALKFFILKTDIRKNITFNPEESIDFQGHTGPFVQYTYARIKSVFRKGDISEPWHLDVDLNTKLNDTEVSLLRKLYHYDMALAEAEKNLDPSTLANFIFHLAKNFNKYYHDHQILKEKDQNIRDFRLFLSYWVSEVVKHGMGLLGIKVPERM